MSLIYNRTVTVQRPVQQTGSGAIGYGGQTPTSFTTIGTYQASIQLARENNKPPARLPGDVEKNTYWKIFIRAANGTIQDRDVIVDDQNIRYQVTAAYWNYLGFNCLCERMST